VHGMHERTIGSEIILEAPHGTPRGLGFCGILFWSIWRLWQCRCKMDARYAPNVPQAWKSVWTHMMELLGDVGHVESRFDPFGHGVSVGARLVHGLHRTYRRLGNRFGRT
jgi:hypothetical protein